jgi:excisionase family DNA binding protein
VSAREEICVQLLNAEDVRAMLGVRSVTTVYQWAKDGKLPAVRLSRKVIRFRREDVERLIADRVTSSPT